MGNYLEPGQVRVGQLVHDDERAPLQSCTLTYEGGGGPLLSIPYVVGEPQFAAANDWFEKQKPPASSVFWDNEGVVTLTGIRWRGHSGNPVALGRLSPQVAIFERPRSLRTEYAVRQLASQIDGLSEFAQFRSVHFEHGTSTQVLVTVEPTDTVAWRHSGFSFRIRASAPWSGRRGREFTAVSAAVLQSKRYRGATLDDHLVAQWPLRAMLILAFGTKLYWRGHSILDDQFPTWMIAGPPRDALPVRVQLARTVTDSEEPKSRERDLVSPMFHLSDIGSQGLHRWFALYDDAIVRRAIEPVVEVINGASSFLEPRVMMTTMALEAMGHYRDPGRRRYERLDNRIERCINATKFDWSSIGSNRGIALAVAKTYNDLKHPDRPDRPDGLELSLIANLTVLVMRMQMFDLLRLPARLRENFARSNDARRTIDMFRLNGVTIDAAGMLRRPAG